jgi:hypothetical protein
MHIIWTRTRDLPACSIVSQPSSLPRSCTFQLSSYPQAVLKGGWCHTCYSVDSVVMFRERIRQRKREVRVRVWRRSQLRVKDMFVVKYFSFLVGGS